MKRAADISNSQLHSETEATTNDLSVLRKPIKTSITGWNEARKAYDDGTEEVRQLLSNECDIIYECKICRNMFRSLANFISHKRIYCKLAYNSQLHLNFCNDGNGNSFSNDISTIVQAESDFIGNVRNGKHTGKDLSSIVERLVKREKASRVMKLSDFYEQVNNKLTNDEFVQKHYVLQMESVPETNVAVYQTVKSADDKGDTIKKEVIEINELMDNSRTVLGPDGKIVDPADLPRFGDEDDKQAKPLKCKKCTRKFATEKSLKLHIKTKHIPSTLVFQCPSCSQTFLRVGLVIRHLRNHHLKPRYSVRKMRDTIPKRCTRIDEIPVRGPNRELARLQTDKEVVESQNQAWSDNYEENNSSANICIFCNRKFDRKAVLLPHQKMCQLKKKPSSRISLSKKVEQTKANGWNDRDFDDSSNSNSLDAPFLDENSKASAKSVKVEKSVKTEVEDVSDPITTNKRKRNRAVKAVINDNANDTDDEKSLNVCWKIDASTKIKEESVSPENVPNVSAANNNIDTNNSLAMDNSAAPINESVSNETASTAKDEKKMRSTGAATKTRPKLTSSHCKYCFKKFSNPSNLRRHITMTHTVPEKFTCNLCKVDKFRARRLNDMFSHLRTNHQFGGERAEAFKFITVNDEPPPPKQLPTINRRKERHTEVLQDDEEDIFIETESFVSVNDDIMMDIQQLNGTSNENGNIEMDDASGTNESLDDRRKSRTRSKEKLKKLERSLSFGDKKSIETLPARRPVRNRIMPVKKDFVYDLSTLLKKDYKDFQHDFPKQTLTQITQAPQQPIQIKSRPVSPTPAESRPNKRRNTLPDAPEQQTQPQTIETIETVKSESIFLAKEETIKKSLPSQRVTTSQSKNDTIIVNQTTDKNHIKGAAVAMAKQAVQANRAVFFKAPDLLVERSLTAPVAKPQRRRQQQFEDWPIIKRPPAMFDEHKSKISNIKVPGLKSRRKRPCLLNRTNHANNHKSSLLHRKRLHESKMTTNGHIDKHIKCNNDFDSNTKTDASMKISAKLADKIQMQSARIVCNNFFRNAAMSHGSSSSCPIPNATPSTSSSAYKLDSSLETTRRRMTLMERLAENRHRKLSRLIAQMTIANKDDDSDRNRR